MRHNLRASVLLLTALSLVAAGVVTAPQVRAAPADEVIYANPAGQLRILDLATHDDAALPGAKIPTFAYTSSVTSVSRDGTEVSWASSDGMYGSDYWVYDRTTHAVRQVYGVTDGSAGVPVWMPDGRLLLSIQYGAQAGVLGLLAPDGTMTPVPGTRGAGSWDVSPSGELIVFSRYTSGRPMLFVAATDGTGLAPLGVAGISPAWRHDGARIAYVEHLTGPDGKFAGSRVATITPQGLKQTVLAKTYDAGGISGVAWSPDDATLLIKGSAVATMPATGTEYPTPVLTGDAAVGGAMYASAWTAPDTTAPVLEYAPNVILQSTGVRFVLPYFFTGYDVMGMRIAVSPGLTPAATFASGARRVTYLGSRIAPVDMTGLVAGATYSYSMWSFDASGNQSQPATGHFRLVPATMRLSVPAIASANSTGGWIRLNYATSARGAVGVSIRMPFSLSADGSGGNSSSAVDFGLSGSYTYGRNGSPVTVRPGWTYNFRFGTRDSWGNVNWSPRGWRVQYPYDDRDALVSYVGTWTRAATPGTWLGTTSMTRTGGAVSLRIPKRYSAAARCFSVVATTAPGGGRFKVYIDGRHITTVSTASSSMRVRRTVWTSSKLALTWHTLRLVQVAGSGWVRLDALAIGFST